MSSRSVGSSDASSDSTSLLRSPAFTRWATSCSFSCFRQTSLVLSFFWASAASFWAACQALPSGPLGRCGQDLYLSSPYGTDGLGSRNKKSKGRNTNKIKGSFQVGHDRGIKRYGFPHNHILGPQLQYPAKATLDLVVWQVLRRRTVRVRPATVHPHRPRPLR